MENLEEEIRQGIERIYKDPKTLRKIQDGREKLFSHFEKRRAKKTKAGFENKPVTI